MSIQHIALVLEAGGLNAQEKAVLIAFCNHTDPNGKTFAGEARLMREAGMPRTTFQRWRGDLVKRNLLLSRRRGRAGGGRTTSDTYVNLEALRSMRDPFFGTVASDRPEDENPFANENAQVTSNGPTSGAKGEAMAPPAEPKVTSNGPASGAINGPAGGAGAAPQVEPVTLPSPQGEPSTPSPATASSPTGKEGEGDLHRKTNTHEAAAGLARRLPGGVPILKQQQLAAMIADLITAGWGIGTLERELAADLGGINSHFAVYRSRLKAFADLAPVADPDPSTIAATKATATGAAGAHQDAADVEALRNLRDDAVARAGRLLATCDSRVRAAAIAKLRKAPMAELEAWMSRPDGDIRREHGADVEAEDEPELSAAEGRAMLTALVGNL
jgi:hypothetical protein